jgi:hypothetical protein
MLSVDVMLIDQTSRFLSNNIDILYIMNIATHSKYLHSWRGVRDTTLCDKVVSDLRQVGVLLRVLRFIQG